MQITKTIGLLPNWMNFQKNFQMTNDQWHLTKICGILPKSVVFEPKTTDFLLLPSHPTEGRLETLDPLEGLV